MLRVEFKSPGYHSRLASGTFVHPTRESLVYALALLQRNADGDADRAAAVIGRVLALQDTDPASPTYGVWPWHLEEPLSEMTDPDLNWADFCGAHLAHLLVEHADSLPADLKAAMHDSLRHAARAIRNRDVQPGYTNIAILGGGVCAVAGELLDDPDLLEYGRRRLQKVVEHTTRNGGFSEYNSPPYTKVVIGECERTLELVRDPATRQAAESLRRTAWQIVADSFHPGTQQWAGPHSRTSRIRLRPGTVDFLSMRTGVPIQTHPSLTEDERPEMYALVRPLPCPGNLVSGFRASSGRPRQLRRTFVRGKSETDSIIGTTWLAPAVCLGSVNRSSLWTQRKPLIAYWRTDDDPAVVFRLRFLHDGRDFASMGVRTAQEGRRALSVFHSLPNRGDWHRTLDRPPDGIFRASDLRVRFELRGHRAGLPEAGSTAAALVDGRYALTAGKHRVVIHTQPGRFAGKPVVWELGGDEDSVFLDGICYTGAERAFVFSRPLDVVLATGIELLGIDETPADEPPRVEFGRAVAVSPDAPPVQVVATNVKATWTIPGGLTLSVNTADQ